MRVRDERGDELGQPGRRALQHEVDGVLGRRGLAARVLHLFARDRVGLQPLVHHPLHRALRDAEVAGAQAAVQAADALVPERLECAVDGAAVPPPGHTLRRAIPVQLQPRLDDPDRTRRRPRDDAGLDCREEMHGGALLAGEEPVRNGPLPRGVAPEVDGARGDDADEVWAEALEERPGALDPRDGDQNLQGLADVEEGGAEEGEGVERGDAACGPGGGELGLVEVGLEARFEDVEGRGEDCRGHAAGAADVLERGWIG